MKSADDRRAAFESVATPFMKTLYNRALHLTRHGESAADVVQETFLRAFRTFDNFTPGSNAKAWLLQILYSVFVSMYRKERRTPLHVPIDEADDVAMESPQPSALDPSLWAGDEVNGALSQLPEEFRTVLLLVDVDDLTYEEVAAVMQCPVGTVRSRLSRARKMLCGALDQYARDRGLRGQR